MSKSESSDAKKAPWRLTPADINGPDKSLKSPLHVSPRRPNADADSKRRALGAESGHGNQSAASLPLGAPTIPNANYRGPALRHPPLGCPPDVYVHNPRAQVIAIVRLAFLTANASRACSRAFDIASLFFSW